MQQPIIDGSLRCVRGAGTLAGSTDSGEQGELSRNRSRFSLSGGLAHTFCAVLAVPCFCSIPKQNPNGRRPIVISPGARREMSRRGGSLNHFL